MSELASEPVSQRVRALPTERSEGSAVSVATGCRRDARNLDGTKNENRTAHSTTAWGPWPGAGLRSGAVQRR